MDGPSKELPNELPACTGRSTLKTIRTDADAAANIVGHGMEKIAHGISLVADPLIKHTGPVGELGVGTVEAAFLVADGAALVAAKIGGAVIGAVHGAAERMEEVGGSTIAKSPPAQNKQRTMPTPGKP